jgi:hypothetical protein
MRRDCARFSSIRLTVGAGLESASCRISEQAARDAGFTSMELVATLPGEPLYAACGYRSIERFDIDTPAAFPSPRPRCKKPL